MRLPFEKLWAGRRREDWLLLLLAAASVTLAFVFGHVGWELLEGEMSGVDHAVRDWVLAHRSRAAVALFTVMTLLGTKEVLAPLSVLIAWRLFRQSHGELILIAFCAIVSAELVALLKRNFQIARPGGGLTAGLGFSFPSGHAAGSMAMAIVLSYIAIRRGIARRLIPRIGAAFTLLVGVSRIYLDLHWTSDVVGGWVAGAAFGIAFCALYEIVHRRTVAGGAGSV